MMHSDAISCAHCSVCHRTCGILSDIYRLKYRQKVMFCTMRVDKIMHIKQVFVILRELYVHHEKSVTDRALL